MGFFRRVSIVFLHFSLECRQSLRNRKWRILSVDESSRFYQYWGIRGFCVTFYYQNLESSLLFARAVSNPISIPLQAWLHETVSLLEGSSSSSWSTSEQLLIEAWCKVFGKRRVRKMSKNVSFTTSVELGSDVSHCATLSSQLVINLDGPKWCR